MDKKKEQSYKKGKIYKIESGRDGSYAYTTYAGKSVNGKSIDKIMAEPIKENRDKKMTFGSSVTVRSGAKTSKTFLISQKFSDGSQGGRVKRKAK